MGIITGEIIQEMCDYFIGINHDFQYNPRILNQNSKQIDINKYDIDVIKMLRPNKLFCYTGICKNFLYNYSFLKHSEIYSMYLFGSYIL